MHSMSIQYNQKGGRDEQTKEKPQKRFKPRKQTEPDYRGYQLNYSSYLHNCNSKKLKKWKRGRKPSPTASELIEKKK